MNPRVFVMMVLEQLAIPLNVVWPLNGPLFFMAFQANSGCVYSADFHSSAAMVFDCFSGDVSSTETVSGLVISSQSVAADVQNTDAVSSLIASG